jgi:hypothetical protein
MTMLMMLLAATQAAAAPPAQPAPEAGKKVVREIVIRENGVERVIHRDEGGSEHRRVMILEGPPAKLGEKGDIVIHRLPGEGPRVMMLHRGCADGEKFETEAEGEKGGKKTRTKILLCNKEGASPATRAEALERAAKRIAENKTMPEDVRTRVLAQLNAEIARLKAGK